MELLRPTSFHTTCPFKGEASYWSAEIGGETHDGIVWAYETPIPTAADTKGWGPGTVVFDTIYNPPTTRLLREARAAGCVTINGGDMFVRQAAAEFKLWTGKEAPMDVFRKVLSEKLESRGE